MKKRILIVDDEEVILSGLKEMLEHFSYEILTAASGENALDILASQDVDLIIADINMPRIDGKQIFTAVQEIEPDTPIIIITGINVDDGRAFAQSHQAYGFLTKPIQLEDIKPLVDRALKKGRNN